MNEYLYLCRKAANGEFEEVQPLDLTAELQNFAHQGGLNPDAVEIVFQEVQGRMHVSIQRKITAHLS